MTAERDLAERLAPRSASQEMRRRDGVIDAVNTDGTVDVELADSGVVVPGMSYKGSYRPTVGDKVFVEVVGTDMVVDGALATAGGTAGWLGSERATADQSSITTETDVTGASVQVRVGAGRIVRISGEIHLSSSVSGDMGRLRLLEGSTTLSLSDNRFSAANTRQNFHGWVILRGTDSPSPGLHTYKLTVDRAGGTGQISTHATSTTVAGILVEDLGPN